MTSKDTQNHDITVPLDGYETTDPSYADLYEGAFDDLDERVPIVDAAAERDTYEPYADAVFIASDTGQVSIGTGDGWEFRGVVPNDSDVIDAIDGAEIAPDSITATSASADTLNNADISDTASADRALETDGNGNLQPVAAVTDGDGTKRQIWIIANGASDPADAGPEDIIFEEES